MPNTNENHQIAVLPSRGMIRVGGPEAADFLQGLITNDIEKATEDQAIYAALLTPQGKILFDFFVIRSGSDFLLDCHGEFAEALTKRLKMYRLRAKVEVTDESDLWTSFASFGKGGTSMSSTYPDPRLGELGARGMYTKGSTPPEFADVAEVSEEDYLAWCLEKGVGNVPLDAGQDKTFLLEANFDELNGVDFTKGCYVGQELAARMKHRAKVRKRLMPVMLDGDLPEFGTPVKAGTREIGTLRSGIGNRAVAMLRLDRLEEATEPLLANDVPVAVQWPEWLPHE